MEDPTISHRRPDVFGIASREPRAWTVRCAYSFKWCHRHTTNSYPNRSSLRRGPSLTEEGFWTFSWRKVRPSLSVVIKGWVRTEKWVDYPYAMEGPCLRRDPRPLWFLSTPDTGPLQLCRSSSRLPISCFITEYTTPCFHAPGSAVVPSRNPTLLRPVLFFLLSVEGHLPFPVPCVGLTRVPVLVPT